MVGSPCTDFNTGHNHYFLSLTVSGEFNLKILHFVQLTLFTLKAWEGGLIEEMESCLIRTVWCGHGSVKTKVLCSTGKEK